MSTDLGHIHEALGRVMKEIDAIGKDSRNKQQGFMFRGIDQVYNAMHPLMAKHGIITVPRVMSMVTRDERETKSGGTLFQTVMSVEYDFVSTVDASKITVGPIMGEGMDSGDKGSNKAMSIAHKYALFQLFMIPTEQTDDPDADTPEDVKPKAKKVAKKKAKQKVVEEEESDWPDEGEPDALMATEQEAEFVADQLIQLTDMHDTVESMRDFWKKNARPINKLKANFPDEYERVVDYFTKKANELKEQE